MDLSKEVTGTILSSGKPLGICLFGLSATISRIKKNLDFPIFNNASEMIRALKKQYDYYAKKAEGAPVYKLPDGIDIKAAKTWIKGNAGVKGEEALELLRHFGIPIALSAAAKDGIEAAALADRIGYPVVMKIISPDAIHKSEAGGVITGIGNAGDVGRAFENIRENIYRYKQDARFQGVRIMKQAGEGYDMFIGGHCDDSFGPVASFGYGGIYIEVFRDTANVLYPASLREIEAKIRNLKSRKILRGARGKGAGDIPGYVAAIERVTHLLRQFPQIRELDINPIRVLAGGSGVVALDARLRIEV